MKALFPVMGVLFNMFLMGYHISTCTCIYLLYYYTLERSRRRKREKGVCESVNVVEIVMMCLKLEDITCGIKFSAYHDTPSDALVKSSFITRIEVDRFHFNCFRASQATFLHFSSLPIFEDFRSASSDLFPRQPDRKQTVYYCSWWQLLAMRWLRSGTGLICTPLCILE